MKIVGSAVENMNSQTHRNESLFKRISKISSVVLEITSYKLTNFTALAIVYLCNTPEPIITLARTYISSSSIMFPMLGPIFQCFCEREWAIMHLGDR